MNTLLVIISTALSLSMFFLKREQKFLLMWFSLMCLTALPQLRVLGTVLNIPTCFLLSEIKTIHKYWRDVSRSRLSVLLLLMFIATTVLYFSSPHYNTNIKGAISMIEEELIRKYFFIIYSFICVWSIKTIKSILNCTYVAILLLTFFGLIEVITTHPIFLEFIYQGNNLNYVIEKTLIISYISDRFRTHSMFVFAFDYGYICIISLFLSLIALNKKIISSKKSWTILICSLFGIISCGCRTVYVSTVAAFFVYSWMGFRIKRRLLILMSSLLLFFIIYVTIPETQKIISLFLSTFQTNSGVSGSSLEMRQTQFETVLYYIRDNFLLGNGKRFFLLDLGYSEGGDALVDTDLRGLESVVFSLLLERGFLGLLFYLIFYVCIIFIALKYRRVDPSLSACLLSIIVAYFFFAFMTGELSSVPPTLFIVGALFKFVLINTNQKMIK